MQSHIAAMLEVDANDGSELRDFYSLAQSKEWPNRENDILPRLLFHLLVAERPTSFVGGGRKERAHFLFLLDG